MRSEKGVESAQEVLRGQACTSLPMTQRAWVYVEKPRQPFLTKTEPSASGDNPLAKSPRRHAIRVVAKEGDDSGDEA